MKLITALYLVLLIAIITGCGPHFNTNAKPDPMASPSDPTKITLTVPNWNVAGYSTDGALLVLLVKDPKTFPIPSEFTFTRTDGSVVKMTMVQPQGVKR